MLINFKTVNFARQTHISQCQDSPVGSLAEQTYAKVNVVWQKDSAMFKIKADHNSDCASEPERARQLAPRPPDCHRKNEQ